MSSKNIKNKIPRKIYCDNRLFFNPSNKDEYLQTYKYDTFRQFDTNINKGIESLSKIKYGRLTRSKRNNYYSIICKTCYEKNKKIVNLNVIYINKNYLDLNFSIKNKSTFLFKGGKTSKTYYKGNLTTRCSKCKTIYAECKEDEFTFDDYLRQGKRLREWYSIKKRRQEDRKKYNYKTQIIKYEKNGKTYRKRKIIKELKEEYKKKEEKNENDENDENDEKYEKSEKSEKSEKK